MGLTSSVAFAAALRPLTARYRLSRATVRAHQPEAAIGLQSPRHVSGAFSCTCGSAGAKRVPSFRRHRCRPNPCARHRVRFRCVSASLIY